MKRILLTGSLLAAISFLLLSFNLIKGTTMKTNEKAAVKAVIEKAYIEGIHTSQDEELIRSGFHNDFEMLVYLESTIEKVSIEQWLVRLEKMKAENPKMWQAKTHYKNMKISVTGYAASAQLDTYKGDVYFSTDFLLLYKFKSGWKIVSKIYTIQK